MENHNKGNREGEVCAAMLGSLAFKMQPAASHTERQTFNEQQGLEIFQT